MENQAHCDFVKLRNMLIRTHMHDLKDVTCDVHYENYRAHCIQQMTRWATPTGATGGLPVLNFTPVLKSSQGCISHPPNPNLPASTALSFHSKLTQDSRMESPIPILPLPTPDAETEKLIRMKDEEVGGCQK